VIASFARRAFTSSRSAKPLAGSRGTGVTPTPWKGGGGAVNSNWYSQRSRGLPMARDRWVAAGAGLPVRQPKNLWYCGFWRLGA
jgi:hypothetical protein